MAQSLRMDDVEYKDGDLALEGTLMHDGAHPGRRPGVLVIHDAAGPDAGSRRKAAQLARLGYVAFVLDMFGKDLRGRPAHELAPLAEELLADRPLMRRRAEAALKVLRYNRLVESRNIAAIGYSFGGAAALELARGGADLCGAVSVHGVLGMGPGMRPGPIAAKILVLHGSEDPASPPAALASFQDEMRASRADWQMVIFGGAAARFTDPEAGPAYNEPADRRSLQALHAFLQETFR